MCAILRTGFSGPEVLGIRGISEPEPKDGHVVIEIKSFGLNHAELHMRKGEWAEIADVSGIECVGLSSPRRGIDSKYVGRSWRTTKPSFFSDPRWIPIAITFAEAGPIARWSSSGTRTSSVLTAAGSARSSVGFTKRSATV